MYAQELIDTMILHMYIHILEICIVYTDANEQSMNTVEELIDDTYFCYLEFHAKALVRQTQKIFCCYGMYTVV